MISATKEVTTDVNAAAMLFDSSVIDSIGFKTFLKAGSTELFDIHHQRDFILTSNQPQLAEHSPGERNPRSHPKIV